MTDSKILTIRRSEHGSSTVLYVSNEISLCNSKGQDELQIFSDTTGSVHIRGPFVTNFCMCELALRRHILEGRSRKGKKIEVA